MRRLSVNVSVLILATGLIVGGWTSSASAAPESPALDKTTVAGLTSLARDFLTRRTGALVSNANPKPGLATTATPLANSVAHESAALLVTEEKALADLTARRDVLREWGEAFTSGSSAVTVKNLTVNGHTITLDVDEYGQLSYAKVTGNEPDFTAFEANRRFVFTQHGTGWQLDAQQLLGEGAQPTNEPTGANPDDMRKALAAVPRDLATNAKPAVRLTTVAAPEGPITVQYNYSAMAAYAERYWSNYNRSYRDFNNSGTQGGDCTNFVSQIMRAGGWANDNGWYRDPRNWWYNSLNQTWSWINVGYWFQFAAQYSRRTHTLSNVWYMGLADVLQVDFNNDGVKDHSMTVSYVGSQPYLTYHTRNTLRKSLSLILSQNPGGTWWAHRT